MTRSLAAPIRFSKVLVLAAAVATSTVYAQTITPQNPLSEQDMQLVEETRAFAEKARSVDLPDWLGSQTPEFGRAQQEAMDLVQQMQRPDLATNPLMGRQESVEEARERYGKEPVLIFASRSLGRQGLKDLLLSASHSPDSVVVFRGIPEDANLGEAILGIQQLAAEMDPMPNIVINPMLFTEYNVTSVPTIIIRKQQSVMPGALPEELARVSGLVSPGWLQARADAGEEGDLGVRGPIAEISEPDLIELMKERFARIDWEDQKRRAADNFWHKQAFRILPEAHEDRTRELDPTIYITEDIVGANSEVIAQKGSVINPLDLSPFTQALVIFDPLDADQMERIQRALPEIMKTPGVHQVTYIVTQLDRESGWESYKEVTDALDAPVFLLTPDVQQRFELEYVPSIVTAKQGRFVIQELADREGEP